MYLARAQVTPLAVLIRTDAGSSAGFNISIIRRYEDMAARNDSELARGESNAQTYPTLPAR
jgi:hypothetical protein